MGFGDGLGTVAGDGAGARGGLEDSDGGDGRSSSMSSPNKDDKLQSLTSAWLVVDILMDGKGYRC